MDNISLDCYKQKYKIQVQMDKCNFNPQILRRDSDQSSNNFNYI